MNELYEAYVQQFWLEILERELEEELQAAALHSLGTWETAR